MCVWGGGGCAQAKNTTYFEMEGLTIFCSKEMKFLCSIKASEYLVVISMKNYCMCLCQIRVSCVKFLDKEVLYLFCNGGSIFFCSKEIVFLHSIKASEHLVVASMKNYCISLCQIQVSCEVS